jgi:hypothetical protein
VAIEVSTELAVMQAVGNALAQLPDAESRLRVLQWAADRVRIAHEQVLLSPCSLDPAPSDQMIPMEASGEAIPNLAIHIRQGGDLVWTADGPIACSVDHDESVDVLMRALAAAFGRFAIDWRRA